MTQYHLLGAVTGREETGTGTPAAEAPEAPYPAEGYPVRSQKVTDSLRCPLCSAIEQLASCPLAPPPEDLPPLSCPADLFPCALDFFTLGGPLWVIAGRVLDVWSDRSGFQSSLLQKLLSLRQVN